MDLILILKQGSWFGMDAGEFFRIKDLVQVKEHVEFSEDFLKIRVKNSPVRIGRYELQNGSVESRKT